MKSDISNDKCISVGKNLIHREDGMYILEIFEKTVDGRDYYSTYGKFRDLSSAMDTAKRIERTKRRINKR